MPALRNAYCKGGAAFLLDQLLTEDSLLLPWAASGKL